MGVYNLFEDDKNPSSMSYKAQLALQEIESDMNKRIGYYEHGMLDRETERLQLLKDAETAISNKEFEVWFQPQADYAHHRFFGAEALVRWRHHSRGFLSPAEFIPLLEKSNYIGKVDLYVIQKTCEYMRSWLDILPESPFTVSVNLSRKDVLNPLFSGEMENIVEKYGVPRERLRLEITESAYMQDGECLHKEVAALRERGFAVEIDDFGAGYSSLNSLKDMNFDKLKLDMKFLDLNPENNDKGVSIITAVLDMARQLDIPAIAEGIETDEQLKLLEILGCEYAQGYYYYRPMPISDYEKLVDDKDNVADKLIILKTRKNDKSYLKEITDYFWKIADVDLDTGAYHFIRRTDEPDYVMTPRPKTIAEYADRYIKYGVIHPDDVSLYKEAINLGRIKKQLDEGKERGTYQIRYNMDGTYKWYVFEVTKPTNYSEDNRRVLFTWKEADYQAGAREDAMDIIYNTFIKILRADFLHDRYEPIKSTQEDIIRDAGLSGSIKEYIDKYIDMGVVHPEDAGTYRDFANPDRVLEHFRNNKKSLRLIFRRLLDGEYKWMELVVSKSKDYSDEIPVFIYYLREVRYIYEDTMVSEIEKKKQMIYSQGK